MRHVLAALALVLPTAALAQQGGEPMWQRVSPGATAPAAPAASPNGGRILETQNAGGYTYLRVDNGGREQWVAVPAGEYPVGANVQWAPGATMQNFHSKSLNRTFPQIVFSGGAQVVK